MKPKIDSTLLRPVQPTSEATWRIWQKKNWNIHRGVIDWTVEDEFNSVDELALRIREGVKKEFHPGWLRGFGFGTLLHFKELSQDFARICEHIDRRNKMHGVWQWAILQFDDDKVAIGVHTWLHGYLRPVYEDVMHQLEVAGYECKSVDTEVDKLIAKIHTIQSCSSPLQMLLRAATNA